MPNATSTRGRTSHTIVAAIVGLAFVLQAVFVPLHLARNEHLVPGGPAHGHDGPHHDGAHFGSDDPDSGHEPHPVADHLDQLGEPATPPTFGHAGLALAPQAFPLLAPVVPASEGVDQPEPRPRPPPPRDAAPPRAPPVAA